MLSPRIFFKYTLLIIKTLAMRKNEGRELTQKIFIFKIENRFGSIQNLFIGKKIINLGVVVIKSVSSVCMTE